jgi:hypothetical protein
MSGGSAPQAYVPPDQSGAASGLISSAQTLQGLGSTVQGQAIPGYQSIYNAITTNPYYAGAQAAANQTGATGTAFGNQEISAANGLNSLASSLGQYAPGIAATAFDPQGAGYAQAQQQNTDQSNALAAMSDLAGSPYGVGLAQESNQDFNIKWQNAQQQRQLAGVQGLEGLASAQGGLATAAGNLGTSGLNTLTTAGNAGNAAYNQQQTYIDNALNSLVQGDVASGSPDEQAGSLYDQYLGIGQQAASTNVAAYSATQAAQASNLAGIGSLLGDVASYAFI